MNKTYKTKGISDPLILSKYKEYFKSFIRFKKNSNIHKRYLNSMYLQFRDKYQKFVTNRKNTYGLKFKGNKIYENLPLNIFQDNYILNTDNISKELENKVLEYFFPYDKKEISQEKEKEKKGEKIKLTPIPFKNNILINSEEERHKIQEAKRSAVLMRRVEYTHLIKKYKSNKNLNNKEKRKNDSLFLNDKIYILKGAIIMIEDWWKDIKERKKKKKREKSKIKINLNYFSDLERNKNERYTNIYSNEIKKNKLVQSKSYNKFKIRNKNVHKKPSKLNIENTYTIKSNNIDNYNNNNKINLKLSSNNRNKSTTINSNSKALNSYKPLESNEKNKNHKIIKISENEPDEKIMLNQGNNNNNKINQSKSLKAKKKKSRSKINNKKNNTNSNNVNNNNKNNLYTNHSINVYLDKIKAKIYNSLNKKDNIIKNRNKNLKKNNKVNDTCNNKSTNLITSKNKNFSSKEDNQINNLKIKNHLKNGNTKEFVYDAKDIIKMNKSLKNNEGKNKKKNKSKKMEKKPNLEIHIKTNYDVDRKEPILNSGEINIPKKSEFKTINDLDKIILGTNYNYTNENNNNNIEINLLNNEEEKEMEKDKENNLNKNKYIESKENDIQIIGLTKDIYNNIDENNNYNEIKNMDININDIDDSLTIKNINKVPFKNNENIPQNVDNFNLFDKIEENKMNNFTENNIKEKEEDNIENKISKIEVNNNIEDNNLIKSVIKKYRSYSYNKEDNKIKFEKNLLENNKSKDDSEIKKEPLNSKQFDNLEIMENNENLFILNSKEKIKKIENVKNNFELEIISNKKNDINKKDELIIENNSLLIKNEKQDEKNQKDIPFIIEKLQIEYKNSNDNNIINTEEKEDSEIIPIEQDNNIFILEKSPKENKLNNNPTFSNNNFSIKNTYSSNNNNINNNNNLDSEEEFSDNISKDIININIPKAGNYNLLGKINELFSQNIDEDIINNEIINLKESNNNNININNYKINKSSYYFINSDANNLRSKSENKSFKNQEKGNCVNKKIHIGVPEHIREMYKLYKTKSVTHINRNYKKDKNFEYLRTLQDKFDYE